MYIKLKKYYRDNGSVVFRAQVLRSYRCPMTGRPKSTMIVHVGTISAADLECPVGRRRFWLRLDGILSGSALSEEDKDSIRASAQRRIPRPAKGLPLAP
jgi:hypothetical protein